MKAPWPELAGALSQVLDQIDHILKEGGYSGPPVIMYLAGGLAVNYYCGSRYTQDIDASFSRRLALPYERLVATYTQSDGRQRILHFDSNYNPSFALMHPDFEQDSKPWEGIGNERRKVELRVLSPVDLAVSKISRGSPQDRGDIRELASHGLVRVEELRRRAEEALGYYVGNLAEVRMSIEIVCNDVATVGPALPPAAKQPGDQA